MLTDTPFAIVNTSRAATLAGMARRARSPWQRLVGLMGRAAHPPDSALVFVPCSGIHTWFMRFPIDLVYVNFDSESRSGSTVVSLRADMEPFRVALARADLVAELPTGTIARTGTTIGDRIAFRPVTRESVQHEYPGIRRSC